MKSLFEEIHRRHTLLSTLGWIFILLSLGHAIGILVDDREVLGINVWIKPLKFSLSIAIFMWTIGWLLYEVKLKIYPNFYMTIAFAAVMVIEQACITMQSFRGVPSHFNYSSSFDGIVYGIMGLGIIVNTILVTLLLIFFIRKKTLVLPQPYLWSIYLGLFIVILGSVEGAIMVMKSTHTIGAADGGPGLPFVNWSTSHGDLRVAHFMALHGIQFSLIAGSLLSRGTGPERPRTLALIAIVLAYTAITAYLFWQAMQGQPLIAG